jgi:hypothetical protein
MKLSPLSSEREVHDEEKTRENHPEGCPFLAFAIAQRRILRSSDKIVSMLLPRQ